MYKHAIAVFAATSAGVLLAAAPASAENAAVLPCSNNDVVRITVTAPELRGDVTVADVRTAVEAVVSGMSPDVPATAATGVQWWDVPGYARSAFPGTDPLAASGPGPTATPTASPSIVPSLPPSIQPSLPPSPSPSLPAPAPRAAAAPSITFDELVTRTVECVGRRTSSHAGAPVPMAAGVDVEAVVDAVIDTGAICRTDTVHPHIGVSTWFDTHATGIPPCAAPATAAAPPSLMDSLGVSGLLWNLFD